MATRALLALQSNPTPTTGNQKLISESFKALSLQKESLPRHSQILFVKLAAAIFGLDYLPFLTTPYLFTNSNSKEMARIFWFIKVKWYHVRG